MLRFRSQCLVFSAQIDFKLLPRNMQKKRTVRVTVIKCVGSGVDQNLKSLAAWLLGNDFSELSCKLERVILTFQIVRSICNNTYKVLSAVLDTHSVQFSSVAHVRLLRPHESQHARPPCPSPTPGVHSDSRPSSQWCHPAISSSVVPFSSCPQFLPASESFPMSQLFAWGGQSTGVSALASFLPKKS